MPEEKCVEIVEKPLTGKRKKKKKKRKKERKKKNYNPTTTPYHKSLQLPTTSYNALPHPSSPHPIPFAPYTTESYLRPTYEHEADSMDVEAWERRREVWVVGEQRRREEEQRRKHCF